MISVCTYCGVGCDITAVVEDNKIKKIFAQKDGVVSEGKLCIKGRFGYDFVDSPNRIRNTRVKKSFIEDNLGVKVKIISVGPDRSQTIFK